MFKVKVSNFQSVRDLELEVSGLTVVTAPTHSGKTSLVRALKALMTAQWFQESYTRSGTNNATVTLTTPSHSIELNRKGASSVYTIDTESFGKIGRKVPKELNLAGFGEVTVAESHDPTVILPQIQGQFEAQYQDKIPPAAMTQLLGSFTNLSPYQTAQDKAKKQQSEIRRDIDKSQKERIKISSIYDTFDGFHPEYTQATLEEVSRIALDSDKISKDLTSYNSNIGFFFALKKVSGLNKPNGAMIVSVRDFIQSKDSLSKFIVPIVQSSKMVQDLLLTRETLTKVYPNNISVTMGLIHSNHAVYTSIKPLQAVLTTHNILATFRSSMPNKPDLTKDTELISNISGARILSHNAKITTLLSDMDHLTDERNTNYTTLADLQARRDAIATACQRGLCPLCLNELSQPKPRKKPVQ